MAEHDELIDDARNQTGLDDFGDDSFHEGLERLVRSLQHEAKLNAMGQEALRGRIVALLAQRLQIEDWFRRHPEMREEPIDAPLIGLGLPRTGSTALSFLLAEDPETRSLLLWESGAPAPPPSTVVGPDPRIAMAEMQVEQQRMFSPRSAALVPSTATGPMECQELMALDFKSQIFLAYAYLPSYSNWLLYDADLTSTYQYERRALQLLQWGYARATVAAQVPHAPIVPRRARSLVPRRAVRDDPPRPGRRDRVGGRRLSRDRWHVQRGHRPPLSRRAESRALVGGHGTGARVPRRGQRPPVLRHRLPHHADRPDR